MVGQYHGPEGTAALAAYLRNDGNPALATAGVATADGAVISVMIMLAHLFTKKNSLRLIRPAKLISKWKEICVTGFPMFFIDIAMGILTILFNRQIMAYLDTNALAIDGVIVNVSTLVQCCAYSIGQASQPIFSTNFGAGKEEGIRGTLKYALKTAAFMNPTEDVLQIAPMIVRRYGLSFLLLPLNVFPLIIFRQY